MKLELINCPACNSPIDQGLIRPNQPFNCPSCGSAILPTNWTTIGQLICSKCGAANSSLNKFCDACQTLLQSGCPFCYTQNSIDALYCTHCGADLQNAWQRQRIWFAEKEEFDSQRKQRMQKVAQGYRNNLSRLLLQLNEPESHPAAIPIIRGYGREAVEPLIELLHSEDPDARFGAAHVLGDIGDKRAISALIQALHDPKEPVRYWALSSLGKLRAKEAMDTIVRLSNDEAQSKGIRELAVEVLRQIGPQS